MAQDDPFTIDLFGNTALSSGLGLGVTAFAADLDGNGRDDDPPPPAAARPALAPLPPCASKTRMRGENFHLAGDRGLAKGWKQRARDSIAAIRLAVRIEAEQRPASPDEQRQLMRFTGFGASELANGVFRKPGESEFASGWGEIGADLEDAVDDADYVSLARCTQYAHFTPEFIVRAIWSGLQRLGWRGGRVLEPGIGTGLFPALMPDELRETSHVTGVELDPITARIARLLQPRARIVIGDFARTELPASFDLAVGNPPFSDRTVRSDRAYRSMGLRLHDYFITRAIDLLKPGALAAFVTSSGTMDKADASARQHLAKSADLISAIRLPEGSLRVAARAVLVDVFSCRENATNSGIVARVAGAVVGADTSLPNMGTEDFLSSLSRPALEASCKETPVLPRQRVKDTRAALVEHFKEGHFVHPSALFAPDATKLSQWLSSGSAAPDDEGEADEDLDGAGDERADGDADAEAFREAAE